jgi:hypothetical protein
MATSKKKTKNLKRNDIFSMREFVLFVAVFAAVGLFTLWLAFAAPPAKSSSGSISIATVNGATYNSSVIPKLGDTMTLNTVAGSMAGWEYPMTVVSCYQDVNGDGNIDTSIVGPDVVFTDLEKPGTAVTLGGYSSIWTDRGGSATCRADLDAYGWKGGKESIRVMSTTGTWQALGK